MSELETEHTYQLRQAEAIQAEKLKEVHEGYCAAIEELKEKNEVIIYFLLQHIRTVTWLELCTSQFILHT